MKNITPATLTKVCHGAYFGSESVKDTEIAMITTDSRQVEKDCLFMAIKGERVDGNDFIAGSYEKGAVCCISEEKPDGIEVGEHAYIVVDSCFQALKDIAAYYRMECGTKIIGITGSVGKTSTKEMIACMLSKHFHTLKTQGNYNNEVGVPLTIFRLRKEHEVAVVEMGISEFGEMTRLSEIVKPDMCVITNIGLCHLENLIDRDGVLKAKTEIFTHMAKGGTAYLNGDDDKLRLVADVNGTKPVFFGIGSENDVYAEDIVSRGLKGTEFDAVVKGEKLHLFVPVPGRHMVLNALAAVAIGVDMGMTFDEISEGIAEFEPVGGHSSIIETDKYTIMDDCYNANPVSMKAGIDVLSDVAGRKIAVMGDMFELGTEEKALHHDVGSYAAKKGIDIVICIGSLAKEYELGAIESGKKDGVYYYEDIEHAIDGIQDIVQKEDSILVKASHAMHFEKIVEVLKKM